MNKLFLIAGPCVVENDETPYLIAERVAGICQNLGIDYIFKASFKKANRTSLSSFTGVDKTQALEIIQGVGKQFDVPTITDIHESHEVDEVAAFVDHLQIPAFLCRQTDLLLAAGNTGKGVNIKKGQFLSPEAMQFPLEKVQSTGNNNIWLCERGVTHGYENLIVDVTSIARMKKLGAPVVMDCTHALQQPNKSDGVSGGNPDMIETVALSAVATGADGLFIETHPDPAYALSDGKSMLQIDRLEAILNRVLKVRNALNDE
ncbi:MAG: 3-deoxy-8-phosphooctulonate synthase [Cytophagales bacterium]|nr:3-deoxy-8-phosphooctulonate synthase [Cytophagales bacterium]